MPSSTALSRPLEAADQQPILIAGSHETYQQAREDLSGSLYAYYRIIERLTRANDLDVPYWDVRIQSGEYIIGATASGAYNINIADNLLALQDGDVSAVAFVMAHEIAHHMHNHPAQLIAYREDSYNDYGYDDYGYDEYGYDEYGSGDEEENIEDYSLEDSLEDYTRNYDTFSQELELEADASALRYMAQAGFDLTSAAPALEIYTELYSSTEELDERLEAIRSQTADAGLAALVGQGNVRLDDSAPLPYNLGDDDTLRIHRQAIDYGSLIEEMFDSD
ncbi:MAG: M48 family metalloprotease [Phormidesmis sp.]